jgi:hypothetical protein
MMLKRFWSFSLLLVCSVGFMALSSILPAQAVQVGETTSMKVPPGLQVEAKRFQAVLDCIPQELGLAQSDPGSRIARVFEEWGKDQFERTFGMKEEPQLTQAEQQFEACLESKGFTPMRKLQQST